MLFTASALLCRPPQHHLGPTSSRKTSCLLRHPACAPRRNRELACRVQRLPQADDTRVEAVPAKEPNIGLQLAARLGSASVWLALPGCLLAWLGQPGAALVVPAHTAEEVHTMWLLSMGVGATCTVLTLLAFSRFYMSCFPAAEAKACERHEQPWVGLTLFDPMLRPLQQGLFMMEPGDLSYGSFVLLAFVCAVLESLVGDDGLMVEVVPDLDLLLYMQFLVQFQHGLLLPSWALIVGRFFAFW